MVKGDAVASVPFEMSSIFLPKASSLPLSPRNIMDDAPSDSNDTFVSSESWNCTCDVVIESDFDMVREITIRSVRLRTTSFTPRLQKMVQLRTLAASTASKLRIRASFDELAGAYRRGV